MKLRNIHCSPHTINIICQKGFVGCPGIFGRAKKFVTWINESCVAWTTLKKYQVTENQMKELDDCVYKVVQEVSTRWNSFYYLVDRLILLEDCIMKTTTELNAEDRLTVEDFKALKELCYLLKPYEAASKLLSTDLKSTVQFVIPTMINLKNQTESLIITNLEVSECRRILMMELDVELKCYLGNNQLLIATVCDPRLKSLSFLTSSTKERAYNLIRDTLAIMQVPSTSTSLNKVVEKTHENESFISQFFVHTGMPGNGNNELSKYLLDEVHHLDDATDFWVQNANKYPLLSKVALAHLTIPSSSASSERNNSQMGRTVTKIRNRLDPTTVVKMNIMKGNLDLW
jgi:hypothetical protein